MITAFDLIQALGSWFYRRGEAIFTGGKDIDTGGGNIVVGTGTVDGVDLTAHVADTDAHHNEAHTIASHSDTTATGTELNTLTDTSNADSLHSHSAVGSHTIASHSDTSATGSELNTLTDGSNADVLHGHAVGSHTIASHSDTTATGSELNTLTNGSDASTLHDHDGRYFQESEFSNYPSTEKPLKSNSSGGLNLGQNLAADGVILAGDDIKSAGGLIAGSSTANVPTGILILKEVTSVGTPSSTFAGLYFKTSDGLLYYKNDTGTEYQVATV